MSAVDWRALEGSGNDTAICALLDELIDQTARAADEQRTANLIAYLAWTTDLGPDQSLTRLGTQRLEWLDERIADRLGAPS